MDKVINYCWFGKKPKNKKIRKCIQSWRAFFPEWKIIEWNESNFDVNCCEYVKQAYEKQKWAFVSDYCRFFVLYNYGGLYFDTDVEVLKKFPNNMFEKDFSAIEAGKGFSIGLGLVMFSKKGNKFCKIMLEEYNNSSFAKEGFTYKTICERAVDYFKPLGFEEEDKIQVVDNYVFYPSEYFCPLNNYTKKIKITENTLTIHYYLGSWLTPREKLSMFLNRVLRKLKIKK